MKFTELIKSKRIQYSVGLTLALVLVGGLAFGAYYFSYRQEQNQNISQKEAEALSNPEIQTFAESDLAEFNGDDPDKPIYLGLDGFVYDVTSGADFYAEGGGYHYLAGKDSTEELIFGAEIIKDKYPIIGVLE